MSDWIEKDGKKYFEEGYLKLANKNAERRGETVRELENMLEDVVNELDLSESAIAEHGPLGTPPADLVRMVLQQKDREIELLKRGFVDV